MSTIAVHTPPMPSPASSMVAAGATTFSVLAAGDPADVPVVFLHGAGPGVTAANTWGDILVALASTARCIAPDLPGYGGTVEQAEPSTGAVSWIEHSARAVVSFLDALGLDRVAVVGVGLGSCVALHAATACPDRVDRAVLMSPPGGIAPPTEHAYRVRELYQQPTEAELGALLRDTVFDAAVLGDDLAATAAERMVAMRRDLDDGPQRSAFAFAGRALLAGFLTPA